MKNGLEVLMKKLKIILDVDDTIADTTKYLLNRANKEYGTNIVKEDIYDWNLDIVFPDINLRKFFNEEGFFFNLKPYEDAIYYTKKLIEEGHEIIITTASPMNGFKDKALWLQKYFPHIPEKNLILAWRKECVYGDVMLDDGLHNITSSICDYPIIYDQPWNRKVQGDYKRVYNWKEFYDLIQSICIENIA